MNKRSILFVIDSLNCGGAEKSLISLLPLLDFDKYSIDLMIISRGGTFEKYIPPEVNIINFTPHKDNIFSFILFKICLLIFSIKIRLNSIFGIKRHGAETYWTCTKHAITTLNNKYDIAIAYQQGFPTYYIAQKVCATKKIAWINADITLAGYRKLFNRQHYQHFDHIVSVSDSLKNLIAKEYAEVKHKIATIYDILNVSLIREMAQAYAPSYGKTTLTTVARLAQPKGHFLAIEAAKILKEKGIDFIWQFVGDGPLRASIEEKICEMGLQQHIILLGEQSNPYPYIKNCDIYIQPSIFEGFGITIGEAKILHKPIISTNFDVVYNQLTDEVNGLIVNMTGKDIANAIIRLINDAELKSRFIKNLSQETNSTAITEANKVMHLFDA